MTNSFYTLVTIICSNVSSDCQGMAILVTLTSNLAKEDISEMPTRSLQAQNSPRTLQSQFGLDQDPRRLLDLNASSGMEQGVALRHGIA